LQALRKENKSDTKPIPDYSFRSGLAIIHPDTPWNHDFLIKQRSVFLFSGDIAARTEQPWPMNRYYLNLMRGLASISIPVGYLVFKHVSWERASTSKKRMMVHQASFWGTMAAALVLMHKSFYLKPKSAFRGLKQLAYLGTASLLPILGFEGGAKLGRTFYPYRPQFKPTPATGFQKVYRPTYLNHTMPLTNAAWLG
jgi:hypothetical protein